MGSESLSIEKPEDLEKLKDTRIVGIAVTKGVPQRLILQLDHVLFKNPINFTIWPMVQISVSHQGLQTNTGFNFRIDDAPRSENKPTE